MRFKSLIILGSIAAIAIVGYYLYSKRNTDAIHANHKVSTYTCSMHPQVSKNKPGNCPICGMQLIERKTHEDEHYVEDLGTVLLPTNEFTIGNYETIHAVDTVINETLELPGILSYNTNTLINISTRVSGRIENSYVKYNYQKIRKGDKLFDLYSPEILVAQNNYLFLLKNNQTDTSIIESTRKKLEYFGLSKVQINNLELNKKVTRFITIYSPVNGVVIADFKKNESAGSMQTSINSVEEIGIETGSFVNKNTTLLNLISTEHVWGVFYAKRDVVSLVKRNTTISITSEANSSLSIDGKIDFIENQINDENRNLGLRVNIKNNLSLPIGTLLIGKLTISSRMGLWVPRSSVINIGNKHIAYIKQGDGFKTTAVKVGKETNGYLQILEGITNKTTIAKNAQYLMDSESFIK